MSILKYRAFLTTIEHNSLTKAAEALGYTQPGISHMISSLERELGFPLLVRAKDGVFPTENARYLQYYMQQIISNNEALMETAYQIRGIERGSLKIGTFYSTSTHWLPEIISTFLSEHPNIVLCINEGTHDEMNEWLTQGKVDIAITSLPVPDGYDFLPLWEDPILAVVSKSNPLAQKDAVSVRELVEYPFIAPQEGADESISQVMHAENLIPNIRFRIKGDMATLSLIGRDLGVSLIPELVIIPIHDNIAILPLDKHHVRTLRIFIHSMKHAAPAAKAFIAELKTFIQETWEGYYP